MSLIKENERQKDRLKINLPPVIESFLSFLKRPRVLEAVPPLSLYNFILLLISTLLVVTPYVVIMEYAGIGQFDNILEEMMKEYKYLVMLAAVIIAPLIEEAIFRYHLTMQKKAIVWGFFLALFMIDEMWWNAAGLMIYLVVLYILVSQKRKPPLNIVVYISAFFFGIVHLGNFKEFDILGNFYWIPFLVGVQFAIGLLLSFIRLHYGLWNAIYFHGAYNAAVIIPMIVFGVE